MSFKTLSFILLLAFFLSISWKEYPGIKNNPPYKTSNFLDSYIESYNSINSPDINFMAYSLAVKGISNIADKIENDTILTLIDYSLPSTEKRLFVIDIKNKSLIMKLHVAHGKNTGENLAKRFSNRKGSNMSSLGFYVTQNTYKGKHGYSLRLNGLESSNNNALERAIVIHGAYYANEKFIQEQGRLGRSFGCPAISYSASKNLIDLIKNGSCVFIFFPDEGYLANSEILMLKGDR